MSDHRVCTFVTFGGKCFSGASIAIRIVLNYGIRIFFSDNTCKKIFRYLDKVGTQCVHVWLASYTSYTSLLIDFWVYISSSLSLIIKKNSANGKKRQ